MKTIPSIYFILGVTFWGAPGIAESLDELKKIVAVQQAQIAELQARKERVYEHNVSYNGGISPTITLESGGGTLGTVWQGDFIPYQTQDGGWRLKFNITLTLSSIVRSGAHIAIGGVRFVKNGPVGLSDGQAIAGGSAYSYAHYYSNVTSDGNVIITRHAEGITGEYWWSGDVKLASKPTWAY